MPSSLTASKWNVPCKSTCRYTFKDTVSMRSMRVDVPVDDSTTSQLPFLESPPGIPLAVAGGSL